MRASTDNRKQVKEWYSLQDIAELFGRSIRFARSLMDKGMPYVRLGGIIRVSRKEFWRWLNVPDPGKCEPALLSIKELTEKLDLPLAAGYRFKDTLPSTMVVHVGGLWFVQAKQFTEWLNEMATKNKKELMEEKPNGKCKEYRNQNNPRRPVSER